MRCEDYSGVRRIEKELRKQFRRFGIDARNGLAPEVRKEYSARAVERILRSDVFTGARTVMLYSAVKGELSLDGIVKDDRAKGKVFAYPVCTGRQVIKAFVPNSAEEWQPGMYDIPEPVPYGDNLVDPCDLDLIICPCTTFDCNCGRLGMGAGCYDRFLKGCKNAVVAGAAFEVQKVDYIPPEKWDRRMDIVFTEAGEYGSKELVRDSK